MPHTNIKGVHVEIENDIVLNEKTQNLISNYINARFSRPGLLYRSNGQHYLRFATPNEIEKAIANNTPCVKIAIGEASCTIYFMGGATYNDLTAKMRQIAIDMWTSTIHVENGQDGNPWIND